MVLECGKRRQIEIHGKRAQSGQSAEQKDVEEFFASTEGIARCRGRVHDHPSYVRKIIFISPGGARRRAVPEVEAEAEW
jgi:hypothetical protein